MVQQVVTVKRENEGMKCPICGANIEITEYDNGTVLIRQDCICDLKANEQEDQKLNRKTET